MAITISPAGTSLGTNILGYNSVFSTQLTASGGTPPYTWSWVTQNGCPLTLDTVTGLLYQVFDINRYNTYGYPAYNNSFTIRATDSLAATATKTYSLSVINAPPRLCLKDKTNTYWIDHYSHPFYIKTGKSFSVTFTIVGGAVTATGTSSPFTVTLVNTNPRTVTVISGNVGAVGSKTLNIVVTDGNGYSSTTPLHIEIVDVLPVGTAEVTSWDLQLYRQVYESGIVSEERLYPHMHTAASDHITLSNSPSGWSHIIPGPSTTNLVQAYMSLQNSRIIDPYSVDGDVVTATSSGTLTAIGTNSSSIAVTYGQYFHGLMNYNMSGSVGYCNAADTAEGTYPVWTGSAYSDFYIVRFLADATGSIIESLPLIDHILHPEIPQQTYIGCSIPSASGKYFTWQTDWGVSGYYKLVNQSGTTVYTRTYIAPAAMYSNYGTTEKAIVISPDGNTVIQGGGLYHPDTYVTDGCLNLWHYSGTLDLNTPDARLILAPTLPSPPRAWNPVWYNYDNDGNLLTLWIHNNAGLSNYRYYLTVLPTGTDLFATPVPWIIIPTGITFSLQSPAIDGGFRCAVTTNQEQDRVLIAVSSTTYPYSPYGPKGAIEVYKKPYTTAQSAWHSVISDYSNYAVELGPESVVETSNNLFTYTYTSTYHYMQVCATYTGTETAHDVTLVMTIPAGIVIYDITGGGVWDEINRTITWTYVDIAPNHQECVRTSFSDLSIDLASITTCVGSSVNVQLVARGGNDSSYTFSTTDPLYGLNLSASGLFTGATTSVEDTDINVTVVDGSGASVSSLVHLLSRESPIIETITTFPLVVALGDPFTFTYTVTNPEVPFTYLWTYDNTGFPTWLDINTTDTTITFSGTSTDITNVTTSLLTEGTYCPSIPANIDLIISYTEELEICSNVTASSVDLKIVGTGGTAPYTFSTTSTLPTGLTLLSTGYFSGQATQVGVFPLDVVITSSGGFHTLDIVTLTVLAGPTLPTISPVDFYQDVAKSVEVVTASISPVETLTWTVTGLPTGLTHSLSLDTLTLTISGTATDTIGTYPITLNAETALGCFFERIFQLNLYFQVLSCPTILETNLLVDSDISCPITLNTDLIVEGDTSCPTILETNLTVEGDTSCPITLNADLIVEGDTSCPVTLETELIVEGDISCPTTLETNLIVEGDTSCPVTLETELIVEVEVTCSDSVTFDLTIIDGLVITTTSVDCCENTAISASIEAAGSSPPFTFSTPSVLPAGITFNSDGTFTGTPTELGIFSLVVTVTDSADPVNTVEATIPLTVHQTPVIDYILPLIVNGVFVSFDIESQVTETSTVTWTATGLPSGLTTTVINDTKTLRISGTPNTSGTYAVTITATNEGNCSDVTNFDALVYDNIYALCFIGTACLNEVYFSTILIQDGTQPYTADFITASIPPGLEVILDDLNSVPSSIVLQGIPTVTGTYIVTYTITDANNISITKYCPINIIDCGSGGGGGPILGHLISLPSDPIVVEDPFHQKYLSGMLPSPYEK